MRKFKIRQKLLLFCGIVLVLVLTMHRVRFPVLITVPFIKEHVTGQPLYVLFNPWRTRSPENAADQILSNIAHGHCAEALEPAVAMTPIQKSHICQMFSETKLSNWQLRNRKDFTDRCEMYFWHEHQEGIWITLRKVDNGWRLSDLDFIS